MFTDYAGTITLEAGNKIKAWLIDGEEVKSYTEIKREAIEYISQMAETYPQVASQLKELEQKKKEEIGIWTYQEVMDYKARIEKAEPALLSKKIIALAKKQPEVADKVKQMQEKLGKKFDQFTLEEMRQVLA
ncbi:MULTISPECIES: hypothetical protein [unclassified Thermoactinomyces]|uniref:hypothetical protein n=1 Tax=unclassified Thermoactinomyces TaxID=2634588 RepID=UPI0018DDCCAA|nr:MULTISPECIES: hypothetical protein [unclassified Thermoactinomyces]MBH8604109.1 hypothetical protein [Thermoactinomyces sp. CICC 10522]MBH8608679.1 hypothetical protein [Thermoactinomyces sp. CICC 10521]